MRTYRKNSHSLFSIRSIHPILILLGAFLSLIPTESLAQVLRDPSGLAVVSTSVTRLGGAAPHNSLATGTISTVENENVVFRIATRGLDQTAESIIFANETRRVVFSQGISNEKASEARADDPFSFELAFTAQSPIFALPWLTGRLKNPDVGIEYLGPETLSGGQVSHVRLTNTFASIPTLKSYASFTMSDVWISADGLPVKIAFERREAGGAAPGIPVSYEFSDYRTVNGYPFPFRIVKYVNGSLHSVISVQSVAFNVELPEAEFALTY